MLGARINLFDGGWVDTVFEGRNKSYGAYELRRESSKIAVRALIIGSIVFSVGVAFPMISKYIFGAGSDNDANRTLDTKIVMATIEPVKKPEEIIHKPVVEKKTKSLVEVVKHVPPVIVDKEEVEQELATIDDFKDKITGADNIEASEDGELILDNSHAEITVDAEIVDASHVYTSVEVMPEYPGGIAEFYKYVQRNFRVPRGASDGQIIVSFVVEVDGSLTNIKVLRDLGFGSGDQAVRLLEKSKKWNPGVQNGRSVRVSYTLPIRIQTG